MDRFNKVKMDLYYKMKMIGDTNSKMNSWDR